MGEKDGAEAAELKHTWRVTEVEYRTRVVLTRVTAPCGDDAADDATDAHHDEGATDVQAGR
ncbi:hypothetical protein [Streptomyces sp. NPDC060031]|uniref:hypothetical protein n=1 Tax=Streptomyces sp. NPDC060031 TaxID=3347043 RepID=UPI0036AFD935